MPWAVVHSARVKAFRQVQGIKAKTDPMDARLLRDFGRDRLNASKLRIGRAEDVMLNALMARLRQLKAALHAEQCRRETAAIEPVRASIERMIVQLEAELVAIEAELACHEANDLQLAFKEKVMCERKGVAQATARALLAELPEIGRLDRREIASLGGLASRVDKSGRSDRRRGRVRDRRGRGGRVPGCAATAAPNRFRGKAPRVPCYCCGRVISFTCSGILPFCSFPMKMSTE